MKVRTHGIWEELEVPESIEKRFLEDCKAEGILDKPEEMEDWLSEWLDQEVEDVNGEIIPEEEAEFLSTFVQDNGFDGGYPFEDRVTFEVGGKKYTIIAAGQGERLAEKYATLSFFIFEEKADMGTTLLMRRDKQGKARYWIDGKRVTEKKWFELVHPMSNCF